MKNYLLSMLLLLGGVTMSMGQIAKPLAKDLSIGFKINGLQNLSLDSWSEDQFDVPQVMVRYYLMDRIALRATVGAQGQNSSQEFSFAYTDNVRFANPTRVDTVAEQSISQFGFSISPGAEWHLGIEAPRLDPYVGAEIPVSFRGTRSESLDNEFTFTDAGGTVTYKEDINTKTEADGGLSVGLNLLGGFNFFITPNVALGAEYHIGVAYSQLGGDVRVTSVGVIQPTGNVDNQVAVNESQVFKNTNTTLGVNTASSGGINLSIFW
jgi:hypothetical protein